MPLVGKTILVTGVAGFIGGSLAVRLLNDYEDIYVVGIDNMSDYYDVRVKEWRIKQIEKVSKGRFAFFSVILPT